MLREPTIGYGQRRETLFAGCGTAPSKQQTVTATAGPQIPGFVCTLLSGFQSESVFPFDALLDFVGVGGKRCKSFTTEPQTRRRRENPLDGQIELGVTE